jgi:acyl-CoA thioester hydrolase
MGVQIITDYPQHYELKTRWKDIDSFGHVNNAVFLTYIEDARIMYFKRWNVTEKKRSLIVASIKIDYLRQIEHPSDLIVGQKISRIGNSSFDIQSAIFLNNDPKPAANSVVSCVCFDYQQNKSDPVYDEIKADFQLDK